jgi:hypothetical protein
MPVFVRPIPSGDRDFVAAVERRVTPLPEAPLDQVIVAIERSVADLRGTYPAIRVRLADPLAVAVPGDVIVYVFRDGTGFRAERDR